MNYFKKGTHLAATVIPFLPDGQIDEAGLRNLLTYLSTRKKINGVVFNAHAGEVDSLSYKERQRVIEIGAEEVKSKGKKLIAGISPYPDTNQGGINAAKDAEAIGADALLVMGPRWFGWGIDKTPEIVQSYVEDIARSVKIPIFFFMTGEYAGIKYTKEMLVKLFEIETVIGIKDTTWATFPYEENYRALHALPRKPIVLTGNDTILLYNFLAGADGTLLVLHTLFPELITEMYDSVNDGNLTRAFELHNQQKEITRALFEYPMLKNVSRFKELLKISGKIEHATVRSPLPVLSPEEKARLVELMQNSHLFE